MRAGEIEPEVIDHLRAAFRQSARAHADDITEAEARAALHHGTGYPRTQSSTS